MLVRASCLVQRSTRPMVSLAWMRARFLAVWRSTLPIKGFGMEMQYGSHANISHQPPVGRDFVDLRLFLLLPPSSSKSHQHQPPQSATGPCLGTHTHTKARNRLTNTRVETFLQMMLKTFLENAMNHWGSFNIPFLLLFSEIIPCEKSFKIQFIE